MQHDAYRPSIAHQREGEQPIAAHGSGLQRTESSSLHARGRVAWDDGVPVVGAKVASSDGVAATTDASGFYELALDARIVDSATSAGVRLKLSVEAPCWIGEPHVVELPARSADPHTMHVDVCSLPWRVDVRVRVVATPAIMTVLQAQRIECVRVVATEALASPLSPPVASCSVVPVVGEASVPLRVRRATGAVTLGARLERAGDSTVFQYVQAGDVVSIDRAAVTDYVVRLGTENLIMGAVVDHLDEPLPGARVELSLSTSTGMHTQHVYCDDNGEFCHHGFAGVQRRAIAHHLGAESAAQQLIAGNHDCKLQIDLRDHRVVRVVRGAQVLNEFDCGYRTYLFGKHSEPALTKRPKGTAWLPKHIQGEPLFLAWRKEGRVHEQSLGEASSTAEKEIVVDVDTLPMVALGAVEFVGLEAMARYRVQLDLEAPLSALPRGSRSVGFHRGPPRLLGVPRGSYRLAVWEKNAAGVTTSTCSVVLELGGEDKSIDVMALMSR